jgi:hypothetical protein
MDRITIGLNVMKEMEQQVFHIRQNLKIAQDRKLCRRKENS